MIDETVYYSLYIRYEPPQGTEPFHQPRGFPPRYAVEYANHLDLATAQRVGREQVEKDPRAISWEVLEET